MSTIDKPIKRTKSKIISISLSHKEDRELTQFVKQSSQSKSQFIRQAIEEYRLKKEWDHLTVVGAAIGRRLGIKTDEDVERLFR